MAIWSDRIKLRSPFLLAGILTCIIGFSINISDANAGVKYFGTFLCVTGSYATLPGSIAWCGTGFRLMLGAYLESTNVRNNRLGNNLAGQYKRGLGMAFQIGIGNLSSVIVSNIYLQKDVPRYVIGRTSSNVH